MSHKIIACLFLAMSLGTTSQQNVNDNHINPDYHRHRPKGGHNVPPVQPDPPPKNETARMARYIVHYSDWCALAHISRHSNTTGYPVARVYSTADGYRNTSTGTPYFYISRMDAHINDLATDGRCSVTMSLAEGEYCRKESLDPEDPRCAQVILTGKFIFLDPTSSEWLAAKSYLFERHPVMSSWPEGHNWQVGKIKIGHIQVADNFGGSAYPPVKDYFDANPY